MHPVVLLIAFVIFLFFSSSKNREETTAKIYNFIMSDIWNNNPGNLILTAKDQWQGLINFGSDDHFCKFSELKYGLRAKIKNDMNGIKAGYNTLTKFISRYAPSIENDTVAYIKNVSSWTGYHPDDILKTDKDSMKNLVLAMVRQETGKKLTESQFNEAWSIL